MIILAPCSAGPFAPSHLSPSCAQQLQTNGKTAGGSANSGRRQRCLHSPSGSATGVIPVRSVQGIREQRRCRSLSMRDSSGSAPLPCCILPLALSPSPGRRSLMSQSLSYRCWQHERGGDGRNSQQKLVIFLTMYPLPVHLPLSHHHHLHLKREYHLRAV